MFDQLVHVGRGREDFDGFGIPLTFALRFVEELTGRYMLFVQIGEMKITLTKGTMLLIHV